jgi:hypothetical protein
MMNISPSAPAKAVVRKAWLSACSSWSPVHSQSMPRAGALGVEPFGQRRDAFVGVDRDL